MTISEYKQGQVTVLTLTGRLDLDGATQLEQQLEQLRAYDKTTKIVLELSGVDYVNSTGLRVLAKFIKQNSAAGESLRLVGVTPNVQRAMDIVGFQHFCQSYPSLQAALSHF